MLRHTKQFHVQKFITLTSRPKSGIPRPSRLQCRSISSFPSLGPVPLYFLAWKNTQRILFKETYISQYPRTDDSFCPLPWNNFRNPAGKKKEETRRLCHTENIRICQSKNRKQNERKKIIRSNDQFLSLQLQYFVVDANDKRIWPSVQQETAGRFSKYSINICQPSVLKVYIGQAHPTLSLTNNTLIIKWLWRRKSNAIGIGVVLKSFRKPDIKCSVGRLDLFDTFHISP
ncbi:hypothetical protein AVEN_72924-1 [Araneus ventricosus]|uniref:Uncharacterized protein n=1 Tax=Araneus ventricosus TaxID=182803 RepID=A0A4Y2H0X5_ARAVE|nr:hypothetical protein AVEN_72924-1 [Araneus ventricosus]